MTAYVHIGTMKTGTSSIQNFLYTNRKLLIKQKFLYPETIVNYYQHWFLANFTLFCVENDIRDIKTIKNEYYLRLIYNFKEELQNNKNCKIIISSEGLTREFFGEKYVVKLKHILYQLGITKVFICIYLREPISFASSFISQDIKGGFYKNTDNISAYNHKLNFTFNYKFILDTYSMVFGVENIIIKIFDDKYTDKINLLKDFVNTLGCCWSNDFIIPDEQNKSLNLLGIELLRRIDSIFPNIRLKNSKIYNRERVILFNLIENSFTFKDKKLKFYPKKEVVESYVHYFKKFNKYIKINNKDLINYKENYELKEMKPEYWDKLVEFIAEIIWNKNQIILDKENEIQRQNQIVQNLSYELDAKKYLLYFQTKYGTAKARIQNQLSYKLGQALIINSKSIFGILCMPIYIISTIINHNQEQKIYKAKIKKDPSLKLPPLENYPDYQEAIKLKNHLSYKLGQALIKANKTWYGGGVYQVAI